MSRVEWSLVPGRANRLTLRGQPRAKTNQTVRATFGMRLLARVGPSELVRYTTHPLHFGQAPQPAKTLFGPKTNGPGQPAIKTNPE